MRVVAVRAARLFDGVTARVVERPTVLVKAGQIVAVEQSGVEPLADAEIVDLGDVTLLPGLIDTHVHLGFDASHDPVARMRADDDATLARQMRQAARQSLAAGITTVRDLGDRGYLAVALRETSWASDELGPEILASGPPLTVTGGHCHFMGGEADGEAQIREGVRERARRGVDVIKIMASGGVLTPGVGPLRSQYSPRELSAAVEEAHECGLRVLAHAHAADVVARAVEAGVDGIEHGGFWVDGGIRADQAVIDRIAEQGIVVCPTLGIMPAPDLPPPPPEVAAWLEAIGEVVARMHEAGARVVAGTDAGIAPRKPHGVLPYAVREFATLGMSNADALASATSVAADACGVAGRKGRLSPGKDADMLAVGGNPLTDLRALHDVRAVFRAGVLVGAPGSPSTL